MASNPASQVRTTCPECRQTVLVSPLAQGKSARCRHCAAAFVVPKAQSQPRRAAPRDLEDAPRGGPSRLPWIVAGVGTLAAAVLAVAVCVLAFGNRKPAAAPTDPPVAAANPPVAKAALVPQVPVSSASQSKSADPANTARKPTAPLEPPPQPEPNEPPVAENPGPTTPLVAERPAPPKQVAIDRVKQSVVLVNGKSGHGSGFLIHPNVVATNSHVIATELISDVTVRFSTNGVTDDTGYKVRLLHEDKPRDLALLWVVDAPERKPLQLVRDFDPSQQQEVFVIGNPAQGNTGVALGNTVGTARVNKDSALIDGKAFHRLDFAAGSGDVRIGPGNSGGPVVDRSGAVIGVLAAGEIGSDGRPRGKAYCIPVKAVQDALTASGPEDKWESQSRRATGLHALAIVVPVLDVEIQLAGLLAEARANLHKEVAFDQNDLQALKAIDAKLIAAFKKVDADLQTFAKPFTAIVLGCKELTNDEMEPYRTMLDRMKRLREIVTQTARITATDTKRIADAKEQALKAFDRYCANAGLKGEFVGKLQKRVLNKAGVSIDEK